MRCTLPSCHELHDRHITNTTTATTRFFILTSNQSEAEDKPELRAGHIEVLHQFVVVEVVLQVAIGEHH